MNIGDLHYLSRHGFRLIFSRRVVRAQVRVESAPRGYTEARSVYAPRAAVCRNLSQRRRDKDCSSAAIKAGQGRRGEQNGCRGTELPVDTHRGERSGVSSPSRSTFSFDRARRREVEGKGEGERRRRISRRIIASCFTLSDCITGDTRERITGPADLSPWGLRRKEGLKKVATTRSPQ